MAKKILSIGAGKGGLGKTFIASGIGVTLAQQGKRCLLIDLDPSGANVHTALGMDQLPGGMEKYWFESAHLKGLTRKTLVPNLSIIQGLYNHWVPTTFSTEMAKKLLNESRELDFDYLILDIGPGNSPFQLQLLASSDQTILITTPEPGSIEKTYRMIEAVLSFDWSQSDPKMLHRLITDCLTKYRKNLCALEMGFHDFVLKEFPSLASETQRRQPANLSLIVNSARSPEDESLGYSIRSVAKKHFSVDLQYLGSVEFDNAVWQTMRNYQMVLLDKPLTPVTAQILGICRSLIDSKMDASVERAVI